MIEQVDAALREIVTDDALEGADLDVVFDAKTRRQYRQAMASDGSFDEMMDGLSDEDTYHRNMDY